MLRCQLSGLLLQAGLLGRSGHLALARCHELLRCVLAKACLLRCDLRLLRAQLANALASLHLTALLLLKSLHGLCLRLAKALRQ